MLLTNSRCPASYFPDTFAIFLHEHPNIKWFALRTVQVQIGLKEVRTISYKFMNPYSSFFQAGKLSPKNVVTVISSNQPQTILMGRCFNKHCSFPVCPVLWFYERVAFMSKQPFGKLISSGILACFRQMKRNIRVIHKCLVYRPFARQSSCQIHKRMFIVEQGKSISFALLVLAIK
ncbi:hypothetical protein D3C73_1229980 [compost metagenome]